MKKAQNHPQITKEYLDTILRYDPNTGILRWLVDKSPSARYGHIAGHIHNTGYTYIKIDGVRYSAHRLIWFITYGSWPINQIDHENHIRSCNTIDNIKEATSTQNNRNATLRVDNKSGVSGVYWSIDKRKWVANISIGGRTVYLGIYEDFFDAVCARKSADIKYGFHANHGQSL